MIAMAFRHRRSILVINPNTTKAMTDGLKPLVEKLGFESTHFEYYTAPSGVPSINNEEDAAKSAQACLPDLEQKLSEYDAFLVCCYSQHPLVPQLRKALADANRDKPVTGIFEASVATCLQSINVTEKFGIVSTGCQWEEILEDAVTTILGAKFSERYAGCQTTGLNADELHTAPKEVVERKMVEATKKLVGGKLGAKAVCLGCAGMAGMEEIVRKACVEELGEEQGKRIKIVDGVIAGAVFLEGALRAGL